MLRVIERFFKRDKRENLSEFESYILKQFKENLNKT